MENKSTWKWLRIYDQSGTYRDYPVIGWTTRENGAGQIESCFPVVPGDKQPCRVGRWQMNEVLVEKTHLQEGHHGLFYSPCSGDTGSQTELGPWVEKNLHIDGATEDPDQVDDLHESSGTKERTAPTAPRPLVTMGKKKFKNNSYWLADDDVGDFVFMVEGGEQYPIPKKGASKITGEEFRDRKNSGTTVFTYDEACGELAPADMDEDPEDDGVEIDLGDL